MRNVAPNLRVEDAATLTTERYGALLRIVAAGDWVIGEAPRLDAELRRLDLRGDGEAEIDGSKIGLLDSAGAWLLLRTHRDLEAAGRHVRHLSVPTVYKPLIETINNADVCQPHPHPRSGGFTDFFVRIGKGTVDVLKQGYALLSFLGQITVETFEAVFAPRRELPFPALVTQIEATGLTALPILGLLSFLLGVVIAYQGADQLRRFGAEIFTINLLGVSILREIGVLITAIIVAGRSGSAFTASIGSMRVNEEIDAMQTIGLNVAEVLVVPRVLGLMIALPLLTFYADVMAMLGGALMCYADLNITFPVFMRQLEGAISLSTLWVGLVKAPVFAFMIGLVGCFEGLRVERNAESVGKLTTRSVVESIFLVIVCDAAFSILFSVLEV
ncbi:MAG: MlaE family lipid ABC transporter permease subunit [Alphaproteobacteria bacterium]|nr:MlaE family lipid ABC transporter permease subunit [Alphaproteobacteria bacterium]